jgi:hypothetical protein
MLLAQPADRFRPYLLTGERILWTGQPKQGLTFSARDTFLIPFSLLWGGFAIFWNVGVWTMVPYNQGGPDWFFRLWGLPFLAAGLYFIFGRFLHDASIRKHLFYAVTDQRVLLLRRSKITSLDIHRLPRLELSEHSDGSGTITFEPPNFGSWGGMNGFSWWTPAVGGTQFFHITDPRKIYELTRDQAHS